MTQAIETEVKNEPQSAFKSNLLEALKDKEVQEAVTDALIETLKMNGKASANFERLSGATL